MIFLDFHSYPFQIHDIYRMYIFWLTLISVGFLSYIIIYRSTWTLGDEPTTTATTMSSTMAVSSNCSEDNTVPRLRTIISLGSSPGTPDSMASCSERCSQDSECVAWSWNSSISWCKTFALKMVKTKKSKGWTSSPATCWSWSYWWIIKLNICKIFSKFKTVIL